MKRFPTIENNRAFLMRNWLPPDDEWPAFAEVRKEHLRLLDERDAALAIASETNAGFSAEDKAQTAEMATAIRENRDENEVALTPPEERRAEQKQNIARIEAANDVLVEFLEKAVAQLRVEVPQLYAGLDAEAGEADEKRAEAARLLAEAEHVVANVQRKRNWLDRISERSYGGHYPYEQMPVPVPPEPVDLNQILGYGPGEVEDEGEPTSAPAVSGFIPETGTITVEG